MAAGSYRLSTKCVADLDGIADYLVQRNPQAAKRVVAKLLDTFTAIGRNPDLEEKRDDLRPGLRVFSPARPAHNYVICYYQRSGSVEISDVIHGAHDWANLIARGER
jgi:toxin ParE1/3/4